MRERAYTIDAATGRRSDERERRPGAEQDGRRFAVHPRKRWVLVAEYLGAGDSSQTARWFRDRVSGDWFMAESWKRPNVGLRLRPGQVAYITGLLTGDQLRAAEAEQDRERAAREVSRRLIRTARTIAEPCGGAMTWRDLAAECQLSDADAVRITDEVLYTVVQTEAAREAVAYRDAHSGPQVFNSTGPASAD